MRIFRHLYAQVLLGIALGVVVGWLWPDIGAALKPLGDAFIKLVKMMIAPIIFTTVVLGIAKIGDLRAVGRVGLKALIYFEVVTTLALAIGLIVVNLAQPGAGLNADPATLDLAGVADAAGKAKEQGVVPFLLGIIPDSFLGALTGSELLPVLLVAILSGLALAHMGPRGEAAIRALDGAGEFFFQIIAMLMKLAPIGAFGAMAFTIGKYGVGTLAQLGALMLSVYATCLLFVFVVLGLIAWAAGFSIFAFLRYIAAEILIVLGTSSSETALPRLMRKLEDLGCARPVVGLVVPTGYSFNLDGTSIYLTMAAVFIAQATNTELTLWHQLGLLGILLLTSKGAAGVTGSGFVTLAATLSATHSIPVAGIALILGIDRFMSEARAITNLIGNGVATIVIARWEGALDRDRMRRVLAGEAVHDPVLADD
ncbi:MAG: dicarboxylate/amino acid:cation symporter [Proteobacteria bacterium]|nr:dicarboxylate/amino acid:cation symporter [Pseudomonadota bacterium]